MRTSALTREEVAKSLRDAHGGLSLKEALGLVGAVLDTIRDGLLTDGNVKIRGFGTFDVTRRKRRITRHPRTGDSVEIPESLTVRFRRGIGLFSR